MPKHKVLKSVAQSIVGSFTSTLNYSENDYVMGHILAEARKTGQQELRVDLLTGKAEPRQLVPPQVRKSLDGYVADLPRIVESSGADMAFVKAANMRVVFDISITRPSTYGSGSYLLSPFVCTATIRDDRGVVYERSEKGWWTPEPAPRSVPKRSFWSRLRKKRR